MNRRRACAALALAPALPWMSATRAATGPPRLGALFLDAEASWTFLRRDLAQALAGLGWQEGRQIVHDWRYADGDASRLAGLAQSLVRDGATALLARGTPATRALQKATSRVPIVTGVGDPVGAGFAASLAAPGGNITGLSYAIGETVTKQLELLAECVPGLVRVHVLLDSARVASSAEPLAIVERLARAQRLVPLVQPVAGLAPLRTALARARIEARDAALGALVFSFGNALPAASVADALLEARVPAVFDQRGYVEAGGLLSYRLNWDDQTQRIALQLDRVLRGADPARMPFELPTRSELVVNARTARALGLVVPAALRLRADEVIE